MSSLWHGGEFPALGPFRSMLVLFADMGASINGGTPIAG